MLTRQIWFFPSFLVHQLQKTRYKLDDMTQESLTADTLNSIDIMDENPLPLLYQSGRPPQAVQNRRKFFFSEALHRRVESNGSRITYMGSPIP